MGVATRGVNYKFSKGDKVLCYEPDPTKAKVLYESKIMELEVGRDERGRKVSEYRIHFLGWNSSWDRNVKEEFILAFTDEHRELQAKLAHAAALSIRSSKGCRLSRGLKPLLKQEGPKQEEKEEPGESSESESSDVEGAEQEAWTLEIPPPLRRQLEEDERCVCAMNKMVRLPCQPCVSAILDDFAAQQQESSELSGSLVREAMNGLRVCFDFSLRPLLLYPQEKRELSSAEQEGPPTKRKRGRPKSLPAPASPSLVYGAQHLLRLFVRLPSLLSEMSLSGRKLRALRCILRTFLQFLSEERDRLFPPSAYVPR